MRDHDFLKGFLVEVMVIYHSVGYFATNIDGLKYLDFVTGAFVFLSGSAVSQYYYEKYGLRIGAMIIRLFARSGKLIALFLILNVGVHVVVRRNYNGAEFGFFELYDGLFDIFIPGSKQLACFEILLPIAYTLFLGAIVMAILRSKRVITLIICLSIVVACFVTTLPFNFKFLAVGLSGLVYGFYRRDRLRIPARRMVSCCFAVICVAYMTAVALLPKDNLIIYLIGVISVIECIRSVWDMIEAKGWLVAALGSFGEYSLFSYLFQIFLLQVLFRLIGGRGASVVTILGVIALVNVILFCMVKLLSRLRLIFRPVDISYKAVFG